MEKTTTITTTHNKTKDKTMEEEGTRTDTMGEYEVTQTERTHKKEHNTNINSDTFGFHL